MWTIKLAVTVVSDREGEAISTTIEEPILNGLADLNQWEAAVRQVGFQAMRQLFALGVTLRERQLLAEYQHVDATCQVVKRGMLAVTLGTAFGKVTFHRQRVFCKTCRQWVTPLNPVLGHTRKGNGRSTQGLKALASLCAVTQPYRLAQKMVCQITQDDHVISPRHIEAIVDQEGRTLRQRDEHDQQQLACEVLSTIQEDQAPVVTREGPLYLCLDDVWVRSTEGKGCWREGRVGLLCTDERARVGYRGRRQVTTKRYIASFDAEGFGSQVYAAAVQMGLLEHEEVILLGDGAKWIHHLHMAWFRTARYILDWSHVARRVCETAQRLFPTDRDRRIALRRTLTQQLWHGWKHEAWALLQALREEFGQTAPEGIEALKAVQALMDYLSNNWEGLINYNRTSKAGYLIASSLVEKAADVVVAKRQKKHQGMHWCHRGADGVCALRTVWLNGEWERYWQTRDDDQAA